MNANDPSMPPRTMPGQEERLWAASVHAGALVAALVTSWFAGVAGALVALGVWFVVRGRHPFATAHAREAFNFNLSMFIYTVVAVIIGLLLIGGTVLTLGLGLLVSLPAGLVLLAVLAALAVAWLVFTIVAAVKAWDGQPYRYPLSIRLLK